MKEDLENINQYQEMGEEEMEEMVKLKTETEIWTCLNKKRRGINVYGVIETKGVKGGQELPGEETNMEDITEEEVKEQIKKLKKQEKFRRG